MAFSQSSVTFVAFCPGAGVSVNIPATEPSPSILCPIFHPPSKFQQVLSGSRPCPEYRVPEIVQRPKVKRPVSLDYGYEPIFLVIRERSKSPNIKIADSHYN